MLVNVAKVMFGELNQNYQDAKEGIDKVIREFDQALQDQMRNITFGNTVQITFADDTQRSIEEVGC